MRSFGISLDSLCFWNKAYTGGIKVHSIESEQQAHYWELGTRFIADMTCVLLRQRLPVLLHFMIGLVSEDTYVCYQGNTTVKFKRYQLLQISPKCQCLSTYNDDSFFKTELLSGQPTKLDE